MDSGFLLITRKQAQAKGLKRYYTGKHCIHGHVCEKYTSTGACVMCVGGGAKAGLKVAATVKHESKLPVMMSTFEWTPQKRALLIDSYVDTGSIETAREVVGVTPSEYHRELDRTPDFAEAIAKATVLAIQTLEDRLANSAMRKGDVKAHLAYLKAKKPEEFSERVKVDQTTTHVVRLSEAELDKRIARYTTIDAEFSPADQTPEAGTPPAIGGEAQAGVAEPNPDDVPGSGTAAA